MSEDIYVCVKVVINPLKKKGKSRRGGRQERRKNRGRVNTIKPAFDE